MRIFMQCIFLLALAACAVQTAHAETGTGLDRVEFVQYLDENTALEEIRAGNIDVYYSRIPSERLEEPAARKGLDVFESTGGSYSLLVNPAESAERFNPFSIREARYALNYLVDRNLIVNELMGGYGTDLVSYYGPYSADYLTVLDTIREINFRHDPKAASEMMEMALTRAGAYMQDGAWFYAGEPVGLRIFIRSDDPIRKSIGEILANDLEKIGFEVRRDYGDLNKAFVVVYGSDPASLGWSIYTEGWGAPTALVKYDQTGLAQMYSPWFSNMPGFNNPGYWNYEHARLDNITQAIYSGNFESDSERTSLMREAVGEGISEAVRIFVAAKKDLYVASGHVSGLVNDFGAGIPSRFSTINAETESGMMRVGVKQIYQGSWNPVAGFTDYYSSYIWNVLSDQASFRHPFTGQIVPLRVSWNVETAGPDSVLPVSPEAVRWDADEQKWDSVEIGTVSTSRVTMDYVFGTWHNGMPVDINDVLYLAYFAYEWGDEKGAGDSTRDSEFTARAAPFAQSLKGIRQIDGDTLEVYVDYWHYDDSEIAAWASLWPSVPWELHAAIEKAVLDGRTSFSKSGSTGGGVGWLSLAIPRDAQMVREYLGGFTESNFEHGALAGRTDYEYRQQRYEESGRWIDEREHAVIGNGPYYLQGYSPESRTIRIAAHGDGYPFAAGRFGGFETVDTPSISGVNWPQPVVAGEAASIAVSAEHADAIRYYVTDARGALAKSGNTAVLDGRAEIALTPSETAALAPGAGDAALYAVSDSVLRTDSHTVHFIAVGEQSRGLPPVGDIDVVSSAKTPVSYLWALAVLAAVAAAVAYAVFQRRRAQKT